MRTVRALYYYAAIALSVAACAGSSALKPAAPPAAIDVSPASPALPQMESHELLPDEQIQQALNRLGFGPRPGDVERVRATGVERWIALQLTPERVDDRSTDELVDGYQTFRTTTADLVETYRRVQQARRREQMEQRAAGDTISRRNARRDALQDNPELRDLARRAQRVVGDVQSAQLARAVKSERQLQEVMVDFWENHFSVFAGKGQTRLFLASYDRDVIRPRALGKFRDLLGAVAKSPAMLFFLDNWQSASDSVHPTLARAGGALVRRGAAGARPRFRPGVAVAPQPARRRGLNENYARELMELHTLGVDGGYSQSDVVDVARALTGWTIDMRSGTFVFRPEMHDAGTKTVLGVAFPAGRGIDDGEQVLDIVARHPSTARFISTKLVRRFVNDSAPPALVERCAAVFQRSDGDIRETVRCIVTSPEFFSRAAYRAKVKTPFEVVASALRALNAAPDTTPRTAQIVARLGQPIFGRQTPDGWPDRADAWMNTGAILGRINFGLAVAGGRVPGVTLARWPGSATLLDATRAAQADGVIKAMLGGDASAETRHILLSGQNPMLDRLGGLDSIAAMPNDQPDDDMAPPRQRGVVGKKGQPRPGAAAALNRPVDLQGLAQVVGLALGSPEFQRR